MEFDYRAILWIITVIIGIYAYYPYITDILKWETKPHIFSWIVFFIMDLVAFFIQYWDNAWPGSWGILTTWVGAFIVVLLSTRYWEKSITNTDIVAFILALGAIVFYVILKNPLYSQFMVFAILLLAMYPTARKTYHKPHQENLSVYTVAILRSILSIFAVINLSFLTIGLPAFIIFLNTLFISMSLIRKKQLWLN